MRHLSTIMFSGILTVLAGAFSVSCSSINNHPVESGPAGGKNPVVSVSEDSGGVAEKPAKVLNDPVVDSSNIPAPDSNVLILRSGTYLGVTIGMDEKSVRQTLASRNPGAAIREIPYGRGGKLLSLGGINFRFTAQGTMFQIYALGRNIRIEGDLKLQQSKVADFEKFLGLKAEKFVGANGDEQFRFNTDGLEIRLLPDKENPDVVFSVMLTKPD